MPIRARGTGRGLSRRVVVVVDDGIVYVKSGDVWYRKLIRDDMYSIDRTVDGGVTWELDLVQLETDEDSIIIDIDDGVAGHRHQVRVGAYCIDETLTATGFAGTEGVDWDNIYKIEAA